MIDPASLSALLQQLSNGDSEINNALQAGSGLGNLFFGAGSLGRVGEGLTADQATALIQSRGLVGQNPRLDQDQAQLNNVVDFATQIGQTQGVSDDVLLALEKNREGIDGFTAPEKAAFLDEGQAAINANLATALRGAQLGNQGANRRGSITAVPTIGAAANAAESSRGLQRDFSLANADLRDRRLGAFGNLALGVDNTRFDRGLQNFGVQNAASQTLRDQRNSDFANAINSQQGFQNILQSTRNDLLNRRTFNLNQLSREKQGQVGSIFGAGGFGAQQQGQRQAFELGNKQIESAANFAPALPAPTFINFGQGGGSSF